MKKYIVDLFRHDTSVTEIKTAQNIRYVLIHNLVVEVDSAIVTDIAILLKTTVESSCGYYYDILEPKCQQSDVDFSSLLVELLNRGIKSTDLIEFED